MQQLQSQQVITTEPPAAAAPVAAAPAAATGQMEEQTIYLDAEGRGTATAIVDGKEVGKLCRHICYDFEWLHVRMYTNNKSDG